MTTKSIVKPEWIQGYQDGVGVSHLVVYLPEMRDSLRSAYASLGKEGEADEIIRQAEQSTIPFDVFCDLLLSLIEIEKVLNSQSS